MATKPAFDIFSELPEASVQNIQDTIKESNPRLSNQEINLARWPLQLPGQSFAVVSFVGPDCSQRSQKAGFCVLGTFDTKENASEHVRKLMKVEDNFDIYVCSMYEWCLCTPPRGEIAQEHCNEKLNELITERKKHQETERLSFEERKRLLLQANDEHLAGIRSIDEETTQQNPEEKVTAEGIV